MSLVFPESVSNAGNTSLLFSDWEIFQQRLKREKFGP